MSLVGTTIGHIRFESLLGMGGMGEVYRAFDEKLQRVVAVKTIRAEHRLSGTARARFLREARILSRLANPLICQVYDLIESEEADLLVLEFVDGETLDQLRTGRRLAERTVLVGTDQPEQRLTGFGIAAHLALAVAK
jgi:serine/threonine-protein kinase